MDTSVHIARMIGPLMVVNSLGMLLGGERFLAMAKEFVGSRALIYLTGFMTLVIGLGIVNAWRPDWPVVLTIIGWLFVVGGAFRLIFPGRVAEMGAAMLEKNPWILPASGAFQLFLGLAITREGFMP